VRPGGLGGKALQARGVQGQERGLVLGQAGEGAFTAGLNAELAQAHQERGAGAVEIGDGRAVHAELTPGAGRQGERRRPDQGHAGAVQAPGQDQAAGGVGGHCGDDGQDFRMPAHPVSAGAIRRRSCTSFLRSSSR